MNPVPEALCRFKEEIQTQNLNIWNINEALIQKCVFLTD